MFEDIAAATAKQFGFNLHKKFCISTVHQNSVTLIRVLALCILKIILVIIWLSLPNFVALILVESQPLTTGLEGFWSTETLSRSLNVVLQFIYLNELKRKGEGAVSQLAFHQCCSGSIPRFMSGSNLLVPYSAFRSFCLVAPVSPGPSPPPPHPLLGEQHYFDLYRQIECLDCHIRNIHKSLVFIMLSKGNIVPLLTYIQQEKQI